MLLARCFLGCKPFVVAADINGEAMSDLVLNSERRSGSAGILITVLGLAAVLAIKLLSIKTGVVDAMSPDDAMRLVEVRDLINGQGWFDLWQYRLDSPGVLMHWSRLIDLPLTVSILLLKPLIGMQGAEAVTLFLWPLLLFAVALMLVVAIARQMSDGVITSQISSAVLALLAVPALVHFRPGAIDHHNAQIDLLLALILFTLQIERSAVKAALAGLAASLSLAIGVEMLPAIAAIGVAVAGLFIWRGSSVARQVAAFAMTLAASTLVLALAILPLPSLASPVCDSLGGPLLLLTTGGGLGLTVMVGIDRYHSTLLLRLVTATGVAVALIGAFISQYFGCVASPYAQLDPLVMSIWLDNVQETISLAKMLRLLPELVLGNYAFPLITLGVVAAALIRSNPLERFRWIPARRADRAQRLGNPRLCRRVHGGSANVCGWRGGCLAIACRWTQSGAVGTCRLANDICCDGPDRKAADRLDLEAADVKYRMVNMPERVGRRFDESTSQRTCDGTDRSRAGNSGGNQPRHLCGTIPSQ